MAVAQLHRHCMDGVNADIPFYFSIFNVDLVIA